MPVIETDVTGRKGSWSGPNKRYAKDGIVYCGWHHQLTGTDNWRLWATPKRQHWQCQQCRLEAGYRRAGVRQSSTIPPAGKSCEMCGDFFNVKSPAHMDHDHVTGLFRGWLCMPCNLLLGHAKDQQERLRAAISYLQRTTSSRHEPL